jgi:iron complex outermembrane recepter protein
MKIQPLLPGLLLTGAVTVLGVQPAWAQVTQLTDVQLEATPSGLKVILQTADGSSPQVSTSSDNQTLLIDVSNAQLNLPSGEPFRRDNPVAGITAVTVTPLDNNRVRVAVIGETSVPTVEVATTPQGLVLSVTAETPASPETATEDETEPTAETEELEEIEIVVTATRTEETIQNVPRTVRVITQEEIQQQAASSRNLADILANTVPGLGPRNNLLRSDGQSLRGRNPAILIDGVSQTSNNSYSPSLSFISPDAIERIEVVPGPSSVYGQGATGGIINIITRRPREGKPTSTIAVGVNAAAGGDAFFKGDSIGTYFQYGLSGAEGKFDYLINLSRNEVNTFYDAEGDRIPNGNLSPDDTETIAVLGKVGVNFTEEQRLQFSINHTRNLREVNSISDRSILDIPDRQKTPALDREIDFRGTDSPRAISTNINLNYTHANLLGSQIQANAYYRQSEYGERGAFDERGDGFFEGIIRTRQSDEVFGGRLQINTPIVNRLSLLWGADYEKQQNGTTLVEFFDRDIFDSSGGEIAQKIDEGVYVPPYDLNSLGLFAQLRWDVSDRLILSGGVRHERFKLKVDEYTPLYDSTFVRYEGPPIASGERDFDDTVFNIGAVYKATPRVSLFANFAQGYLVPGVGFSALGFPAPGFSIGDDLQALQPQKVNNYEIGVRGNWDNVQVSLAGFYSYSSLFKPDQSTRQYL